MTRKEKIKLLEMYEILQIKAENLYSLGSPAIETTRIEAQIEQLEEIMSYLGMAYLK